MLAMFLIDPFSPILGTDKVPPQQKDWWAAEVRRVKRFAALPQEIFDRIVEAVEGFPISGKDASDLRKQLIRERAKAEQQLGYHPIVWHPYHR
jgi:hypothetical protein